jgi:hypothetical protein
MKDLFSRVVSAVEAHFANELAQAKEDVIGYYITDSETFPYDTLRLEFRGLKAAVFNARALDLLRGGL